MLGIGISANCGTNEPPLLLEMLGGSKAFATIITVWPAWVVKNCGPFITIHCCDPAAGVPGGDVSVVAELLEKSEPMLEGRWWRIGRAA